MGKETELQEKMTKKTPKNKNGQIADLIPIPKAPSGLAFPWGFGKSHPTFLFIVI